jgi:trehalose 6-phosphate synthase/phosphatase
LCGYYRAASIALVTPIRDGMNLVAKEFIACQDLNVDPGVLVLSVFAGASESMFDGAILVNPMERDLLADALKNAYDMKFHERRLRMQSLQSRERQFDVDAWFDSFTEACDLAESSMTLLPHHIHSLNLGDYESWLEPLCNGYARLTIILDYDGTLVPLEAHPDMAVLTDDLRVLLKKFIECSYIDLGILSGRSLANLRQMLPLKV